MSMTAFPDFYKSGFEDFAIPSYESAPFTTIQNRASVTRSLKAIAGIERVHVKGITLLKDEFGPNGELVFESSDKDSRIRFVGSWSILSSTSGVYIQSGSNTTDFLEITFYGTGLNVLVGVGTSRDIRPTIDGGAEGANINPAASTVLTARNYNVNMIRPVTSGLTLGWHTVKLRQNGGANLFFFEGFEVLNQRTDLAVYSGAGIASGSTQGLSALATSSFNAGFSGTRGGRVIKYVENGQLKSAIQEVDATAKYMSLADHTNEEDVRRINFRDFGANRADDFSTLAGVNSNRAFTLDDGITSLVGVNVATAGANQVYLSTSAAITITFVGSGIDFMRLDTANAAGTDTFTVFIDGVSVATISGSGSTTERLQKVASGLPYGTHTLRILRATAPNTWDVGITDFIIYQPKKPSFSGLQVADYCVLATYSNPGNTNVGTVPNGVIRKMNIREMIYSGTWAASAINTLAQSGFSVTTTTAASYVEYEFWGTGFNYRFGNNAGAQSQTVSVNGSTNLSGFTTALNATAGLSFTAGTGVITGSPVGSIGENNLSVTGLTLGYNTVRVTWTSGVILSPICFDIVTPISMNDSSFKVGSKSLSSLTKYSPEKSISNTGPDLSKAKAWIIYDASTNITLNSYNVSACLQVATGRTNVYFEKPFKNANYIAIGSVNEGTTSSVGVAFRNQYANVIEFRSTNAANTLLNNIIMVAFFGELIDE